MTVLIYVDTSKQVGDPATSRCSQIRMPLKPGSSKTIQGVAFEYEVLE